MAPVACRRDGVSYCEAPNRAAWRCGIGYRPARHPNGRRCLVGLGRFELPTSPLSGVRSNRLSYRPAKTCWLSQVNCVGAYEGMNSWRLNKEVIQPQVPLRLPCYDFTPVMNHTVVSALPKVKQPTSGTAHSHGMTGGVYKARERIHRSVLILRLLAIPTSRSRVADSDPDYERFSGIGSPSRVGDPLYRPL